MANQLVSSSSLSTLSWRYDVFLSFRGEDTRTNFTDHLYKALVDKGIYTFIDHQLRTGEEISPAILEAIEESRISIIVFSETYASSRWCLDELVKILLCKQSKQQMVWPVFYKVDPSHVRNQTSSFGDAFTKLECKFKDNKEKILLWRSSLKEVANLSGRTVKEGDYEATIISSIVEEILVRVLDGTYLNVATHPVGIQSCVQHVEELLGVGGNGRHVVGIWGSSGIGKTSIAKAVYNAIAHKFQGSCFLADVRQTSTSREGVIQLQKTLLSKILRGTEFKIVDAHEGISLIKKLLRQKTILLILDDVDQLEQLNNLVQKIEDCLGEGSRVIITTQDRGLLESYGVELIYEVQKLEDDQALELFSLNAFGTKELPDDYLGLARRAIAYAQGLPLALNLIGSHLHNKSIDSWQAVLDSYDSYEGEPYNSFQRILRRSFDAWEYFMQQVFLDIACFFKNEDKDYVMRILKSSKLKVPQNCMELLVEKAIITIEDNRIRMHDLLEQTGKHIVYEESPTEPGKRSRLWFHEDVYSVLTENRGTRKIKGIVVKLPKPDVIPLKAKSFLRMVNLEIFINHNAQFSGRVDYLPNDLRWIELGEQFQFNFHSKHTVVFNLPLNYHPRYLVRFDVSYSGIRQLKGFQYAAKLTYMNFSGCEFLEKIPDLSGSPNIEYLDLSDCKSLVEVNDSVGFLDKLVKLDLGGCSKLTKFAKRLGLRSLERLYLSGCTRLESFPEIEDNMESLRVLYIGESGIRELPPSIAYLTGLYRFDARGSGLRVLPKTQLLSTDLDTSDDNLSLRGCNLSESDFPIALTYLDLSRNNFVSLPDCITKLVNLEILNLSGCERLREITGALPPRLLYLYMDDCTSLEKIPKLPPILWILNLRNCFRLSGDEVAMLENNILLNQESPRRSGLEILLPGNEVPKWFSCTSELPPENEEGEFVQGREFVFEIPPNLQGETSALALSMVFEPPTFNLKDVHIHINGEPLYPILSYLFNYDAEAPHVWLKVVNLDKYRQQGDICQVKFRFPRGSSIKSCGVHSLAQPRRTASLVFGTNE